MNAPNSKFILHSRFFAAVASFFLAAKCFGQNIDPASDPNVHPFLDAPGTSFRLAFSDEFSSNGLNTNKWNYRTGTRLDGLNLPANVAVTNAQLHIYGRNETNVVGATTYNFTCGGIITKQSLGYGYYEIQARLNSSSLPGWHQSFWNIALNEVDGFEIPSYAPSRVGLNLHYYPGGAHYGYGINGAGGAQNFILPAGQDSSQTNHIYGWEYTPTGVNWFVDGVKVLSSTYPGPLASAPTWITSVAWNEGGAGIVAPSDMKVDYFRYFTNSVDYGDTFPAGTTTLVDITNAASAGAWSVDPYARNFNGQNTTRTSTNNGDFTTWSPNVTNAGSYEVLAWNPTYFQNRSSTVISGARAAVFTVNAADGAHTAQPVDQLYGRQKWITLGTFQFNAGTNGNARLAVTNSSSTSIFRAGAVVFRRITNAPAAPTALTATAGNAAIALTWTVPVGWSSIIVKRATTSGGPYSVIATGITNRDGYTDNTVALGLTFFYVVAATNNLGVSSNSIEASATTDNAIIKDNGDADGITLAGTWTASTGVAGFYGDNYLYASPGATDASARFTPTLPHTNSYQVYLRWTAFANRATNTPVDMNYAGGSRTLAVNQATNGGTWNWLGTFPFNAGTNGSVTVRGVASGYAIADAVRWVEGVSTDPVSVTPGVAGNALTLGWPPDHIGWRLQVQTNSLGTNWTDVSGAAATNFFSTNINRTTKAVFYRLVYP